MPLRPKAWGSLDVDMVLNLLAVEEETEGLLSGIVGSDG